MKKTIYENDFIRAFEGSGIYSNKFSRKGLQVLYNFLTELEEDTGEEMELDIVAIAEDFSEYDDIEEYNKDYRTDHTSWQEIDETVVIPIDDESFIILNY